MYKKDCGFMKLGCCTFKPEHCRPMEKSDGGLYCDLYDIQFTSKEILKEIKKIKKKIKSLTSENIKLKKLKQMIKAEKKDKDDKDVLEYKKKLAEIKDLGKGMEYLDRAYKYCKRTRK